MVMDPASIVLEEIRRRIVTATQALANEELKQSTLLHLTHSIESSARNLLRLEDIISTQLFDSYLHLDHSLIIHEAEALILSPTLGSQNC